MAPADSAGDEDVAAAMRDFGADEATIKEWTEPETPHCVEVLKGNWQTVRLFYALSSQWTHTGFGHRVGINYASIEPTARMMEVEMTAEVFRGLQVMEDAAMAAIAERVERG